MIMLKISRGIHLYQIYIAYMHTSRGSVYYHLKYTCKYLNYKS